MPSPISQAYHIFQRYLLWKLPPENTFYINKNNKQKAPFFFLVNISLSLPFSLSLWDLCGSHKLGSGLSCSVLCSLQDLTRKQKQSLSLSLSLASAMAETTATNGIHVLNVEDGEANHKTNQESSSFCVSIPFMQKVFAEVLGTYFVIFAGCGSVVVNLVSDDTVTFPGISIIWGLVVMVMIYSVGHISGAHFNPAVTIAFAVTKRFPLKQVPAYVGAQILGSTLAAGTLRLIFNGPQNHFAGTMPSGTPFQSFVIEFIITFYLMFVVSGVATDNRAIGELAGLAVGATVLLNVMCTGPISGASMNPARSIGPAIVSGQFKDLWVYIFGPTLGAVSGALVYNLIRFTDKPLREITKSSSFLRGVGRK